jgi:hypothetical protein
MANDMKALMHFFARPGEDKVPVKEFNAFWKSLTDAEKEYYKTAPLS